MVSSRAPITRGLISLAWSLGDSLREGCHELARATNASRLPRANAYLACLVIDALPDHILLDHVDETKLKIIREAAREGRAWFAALDAGPRGLAKCRPMAKDVRREEGEDRV